MDDSRIGHTKKPDGQRVCAFAGEIKVQRYELYDHAHRFPILLTEQYLLLRTVDSVEAPETV